MLPGSRSVRALASAGTALVLALVLAPAPASGAASAPASGPVAPAHRGSAPGQWTVTLLTGDRVTLVRTGSGAPQVRIEAGSGARDDYAVRRDGDRVEVVPHDVLDLVPRVLDPALFDVTGLVDAGYDDAHSRSLPLIVHRAPGVRTLTADPALGRRLDLPAVDGAAVALDKRRTSAFAADLRALAARPGRPTRAAAATALGGIDRIWLDRAVTAARTPQAPTAPGAAEVAAAAELDGYLTRVGAPAAWSAGLDGTGVRVAVLDSGVDDGHPALAGRVVAAQDFTGSGSVTDVVGHGTHVASLVGGTGAGSDGARQGIAPAADLLNGKVLGDEGEGRLSWVIAGMQWAVDQGADVVNLSLSARPAETDDPVVTALDTLTRETGTLFVVAAGNAGWNGWVPQTVTSPGTAESALTVGASTDDDVVPGFSSQGPTLGSYRTKPDLVAPGVDVLGARAGARDGDLYVPMTGTSMATPIVAGAAALLEQEHPDWSWQQVKSALTTSADHLDRPWASGAGRLAIDTAAGVATTAAPSTLSTGPVRYPDESPVTTTVTLSNTGSQARTYTASDEETAPSDDTAAPESALTMQPAMVTVPAGGTATVDVVLDPAQVRDDYWYGHVDLTGDDGSVLRLPFATYDEPERYWLDVAVRDRTGAPWSGGAVPLLNTDNGYYYTARLDEQGHARLRVAPGSYGALVAVDTDEPQGVTTTLVGTPALDVHADRTLSIDARDSRAVRPPVVRGQGTAAEELSLVWNLTSRTGTGYGDVLAPPVDQVLDGRFYVGSTAAADPATFATLTRWRLEPRGRRTALTPDGYELGAVDHRLDPSPTVLTVRDQRRLAEVTEHYSAPAPGAPVLRGLVSSNPQLPDIIHRREIVAPSTETVLMSATDGVRWGYDSTWLDQDLRLFSPRVSSLTPGSHVDRYFGRALHVGPLSVAVNHSEWGLFLEQGVTDGTLEGPVPWSSIDSASLDLYRDGEPVGSSPDVFGWFDVPAERASYRAVGDVRLTDGREAHTEWRFTSQAPGPGGASTVPRLLTVDYGPSVDGLDVAPRGERLTFDLRVSAPAGAVGSDRIEQARLQWSPDAGRTWYDAAVRRTGDATFVASVPGRQLRTGALSVRMRATDAEGNAVDQVLRDLVTVR